jgi:lysophospholipase L1-like esterase
LVTLLLTEVILRFFFADYLYSGSGLRSLYYSTPNLTISEDNRSVHYTPNTDIRSITVYYNRIEYDTLHHANNLGFLSDQNYTKEPKPGIVFLGDSFTAGVGSTSPWIPQLDKKYPDINLYSFGVTGTGIPNFYRTLKTFLNDLNFDTIVIMSISDDLRRHQWYPFEQEGYLYFCYDKKVGENCRKKQRIAKLIQRDIEASSLLQPEEPYILKAYQVIKKRLSTPKQKQKLSEKARLRMLIPPNQHYDINDVKKIKALADRTGKRVIFIHIPEKKEIQIGYYRCNVQEEMKKLGIAYYPLLHTHHFDLSMYHKHDGHPNDKGYAYIASIIEKILKLH